MIPLTWWIAANTAVTALAVSLAALAFLRADRHMRHARNVVQAHTRCGSHCRSPRLCLQPEHAELLEQIAAHHRNPGPLRFEPPEAPAERTQPGVEPPMLCGDDRLAGLEPTGRHALADDTRHLPNVGDLTGGDHR